MMSTLAAGFAFLAAASPAPSPVVVEPKTGLSFPTRSGGMSLLGVGVRTRTILKLKIYAGPEHPHEAQGPKPLPLENGNG